MTHHLRDEEIESYVMRSIQDGDSNPADPLVAEADDHLLWCDTCLARVNLEERYIVARRSATRIQSALASTGKTSVTVRHAGGPF